MPSRRAKRAKNAPAGAQLPATAHAAPRADPPPAKKPRVAGPPCSFLAQWLWKREAKSDEERFDQPYKYALEPATVAAGTGFCAPGAAAQPCVDSLLIQQRRFGPEGFASTVWDSAIVLAKYLEVVGARLTFAVRSQNSLLRG